MALWKVILLIYWLVVQGHAGKFVFGLIGPQKTPVALLVGRAQSVTFHWSKKEGFWHIKC